MIRHILPEPRPLGLFSSYKRVMARENPHSGKTKVCLALAEVHTAVLAA